MNEKKLNYKQMIVNILESTNRDGMNELTKYMDKVGFFDAPCSGSYHLSEPGGLAEHSYNVYQNALALAQTLLGKDFTEEMRNSVAIAAILHDLGKCGDYGKPMYVDNLLKSGKRSDAKPYKRNKDLTAIPHAARSVKLATQFIKLTMDEEWAIMCHDGLYDFMKYELPGNERPLQLIINWADMWASHVQEVSESDGEE